jgi:GntP family gluconate:H+ symporter
VSPLLIMALGTALVFGLILYVRANAFLALIIAALVVSLLAPGTGAIKVSRVAEAFGGIAGSIGIVIALAAIIGKAMLDSGAAERIIRSLIAKLGAKRAPTALMSGGFILAIPVFFDTVFYLLVPIARTLWRSQRKNYLLYITAIVAGAGVAHSLVPPTPGPIFIAAAFDIDLGMMFLVGLVVGIPMSIAGLVFAYHLNRKYPVEMRPYAGEEDLHSDWDEVDTPTRTLPPFWLAIQPILIPVVLITFNTAAMALIAPEGARTASETSLLNIAGLLGNPNMALLFSAAISLWMLKRYGGRTVTEMASDTESALMGAGIIILITAAGGAFGAMLREAGIQAPIEALVKDIGSGTGMIVLISAFLVASMIKIAQGSGTVSMITTASMFAAMGFSASSLGFHPVYLGLVIGAGSLVGDWMNNSGFWIFSKMGGLTTHETLRTWTPLTAVLGITGLIVILILAPLFPLV